MPKDVRYRILERKSERGWAPFAVAYQRGSHFALFSPGWRSQQDLPVRSLEELTKDHYPSSNFAYRWSSIELCRKQVDDPIELLECAVTTQQEGTIPGVAYASGLEGGRIELLVADLSPSSAFLGYIPFMIRSGASQTVIPRRLVGQHAFPIREANKGYRVVVKAPGDSIIGHEFSASMSLPATASGDETLKAGKMAVIVAESWDEDYGLLGNDALDWAMASALVPH